MERNSTVLPFAELFNRKDIDLLKEVAGRAHSLTFEAAEDGKLRIHVRKLLDLRHEVDDDQEYRMSSTV